MAEAAKRGQVMNGCNEREPSIDHLSKRGPNIEGRNRIEPVEGLIKDDDAGGHGKGESQSGALTHPG